MNTINTYVGFNLNFPSMDKLKEGYEKEKEKFPDSVCKEITVDIGSDHYELTFDEFEAVIKPYQTNQGKV